MTDTEHAKRELRALLNSMGLNRANLGAVSTAVARYVGACVREDRAKQADAKHARAVQTAVDEFLARMKNGAPQ